MKQSVYLQWTLPEADKRAATADKLRLRMRTVYSELIQHLKNIKAAVANSREAAHAESVRKHNEAMKELRPLTTARSPTPFGLAKWCREKGLLAIGDEAATGAKFNFPVSIDGDEYIKVDVPLYVPMNHSGVGTLLRSLPGVMGAERLADVRADLEKTSIPRWPKVWS